MVWNKNQLDWLHVSSIVNRLITRWLVSGSKTSDSLGAGYMYHGTCTGGKQNACSLFRPLPLKVVQLNSCQCRRWAKSYTNAPNTRAAAPTFDASLGTLLTFLHWIFCNGCTNILYINAVDPAWNLCNSNHHHELKFRAPTRMQTMVK
jgi:hypothetical protein